MEDFFSALRVKCPPFFYYLFFLLVVLNGAGLLYRLPHYLA